MRINVNGIEMYYEVEGSGRPLVMVHGNGEDRSIFSEAVALLKQHFTVYAVDSRGHGFSTRVEEFHYQDMADDMVAFMEQLDLRDVVFYGFSDGGIIGLLAAMKTDRITMLITSGANLTPDGVKPTVKCLIKGIHTFTRNPKMKLMLTEPNITPDELAKIKAKTVVIAGEKDLVLEKETVKIADSIPGSKMRIIPGEGHGSYIVHNTRIADIIMQETGVTEPSPDSELTPAQMKTLIKAQQGEIDAALMYEKLAGVVKDSEDKKAFMRLAGDEARHASVFYAYTGKGLKASPAKSILVPLLYKTIGKDKLYPVIAKGEYDAAKKYENLVPDFHDIETVMNDETHHGDAVMNLVNKTAER